MTEDTDKWDFPTCELCGHSEPRENRFGHRMMREYEGTMLCINHYSQAKWPETYTEINDKVKELINE